MQFQCGLINYKGLEWFPRLESGTGDLALGWVYDLDWICLS